MIAAFDSHDSAIHSPEDVQTQANRMATALRTLKPNPKHQKSQLFTQLYPVIVELLEGNVTQKAILNMLATQGLKLHPARFKEMLSSEAKTKQCDSASSE